MPKGNPRLIVRPLEGEAYAVLAQFLDYDRGRPLEARTVAREEFPYGVREKIVFTGIRNSRVPGYLVIPQVGSGPFPVVLQLHGAGGSKDTWWRDTGAKLTEELIGQGYAALSLDAQYHGERQYGNDYESPWNLLLARQFLRFRDMEFQSVTEYRLGIDYLATRPEIDTSRVGVVGGSMGGVMTFMLTAVEPRIKVGVSCVSPPLGLTIARKFLDENLTVEDFQAMAESIEHRKGTFHSFAHAIGERPFLMIMANQDEWYSPEEARQLYDLMPGPAKELEFFASGHDLPPEYTVSVVRWFKKHLK